MVDAIDAIKILGSLLGNKGSSSGGGAGDILGNLLKGALGGGGGSSRQSSGGNDVLGGLLNMAMKKFTESQSKQGKQVDNSGGHFSPDFGSVQDPELSTRQVNDQATILLKAMVNAAKSDGRVDKQEGENIISKLGDASEAEMNFIRNEVAAPLDVDEFVNSVPRGLEQNVYAVSLLAIDLDSNKEAKYLHQLAQGLNISSQTANQIHDKVGAPRIYS